jgi:hypothetical protein
MPTHQCPKCKKTFTSPGSVARHLSQPLSACALFHDLLVAPIQPPILAETPFDNLDVETEMFDWEESDQLDTGVPAETISMESMDVDPGPAAPDPTQPHVREDYPTTPNTWPSGVTFMAQFDQDPNAVHRTTNLYYPFASRGEWQLAFFLISCGMSMNLINQFLRLELVRSTVHSAVSLF